MARIESSFTISGTYGNLIVYRVGSKLFARTRSSLTGKRFQNDPAFAKSREKALAFGKAAQLAKTIYASLHQDVKCKGLFAKITGLVLLGLQKGKTKEELVNDMLIHLNIVSLKVLTKAQKSSSLLNKKQQAPLTHLSNWRVTTSGRLQSIYKTHQLEIELNKNTILQLPDG